MRERDIVEEDIRTYVLYVCILRVKMTWREKVLKKEKTRNRKKNIETSEARELRKPLQILVNNGRNFQSNANIRVESSVFPKKMTRELDGDSSP